MNGILYVTSSFRGDWLQRLEKATQQQQLLAQKYERGRCPDLFTAFVQKVWGLTSIWRV